MARYVAWKPSYSVGHAALDEQHRQILQIVNDLYSAMQGGDAQSVVKPLLERLLKYTHTHFAPEEQIMQECGYPNLEDHKELHATLRRKTAGLRANVGLVMGVDLLHFLRDWWLEHIQEEDQRYAPYARAATVDQASAAPE